MNVKVTPENYPEIINKYNNEGKKAAYALLRDQYGVQNPTHLIKRMRKSEDLAYNPETDRFESGLASEENEIFMNLQELCAKSSEQARSSVPERSEETKQQAMKILVQSLISDRLMELSKYVILDPLSRTIIVDKTSMQMDGYRVSIS